MSAVDQYEEIRNKLRKTKAVHSVPTIVETSPSANAKKDSFAYYYASGNQYFVRDKASNWIGFNETSMKRLLRWDMYGALEDGKPLNKMIDQTLLVMQKEENVAYAGPIGGYKAGLWTISGKRVLVTEGPTLIRYVPGEWKLIRTFVEQLLGEQVGVLFGWLKCGLKSLYAGPPFRPGQMLAIAGPGGCGKSLLQNLITELLGNRSGKPYEYLTGQDTKNADIMKAEHLMIEDEAAETDYRSRKKFGAKLKNLIANETQRVRGMFKDGFIVTPFSRVTITLNDEPENLMVLPIMESSLLDKIILLRAEKATFPYADDDLDARNAFRRQLSAELPAFIAFLRSYRIPDRMRDQRYGVKAFQDPGIIEELGQLAPETKLLDLIDSLNVWDIDGGPWEGTSSELEEKLKSKDRSGMVRELLSFSTAAGVFLQRLSLQFPDRISRRRAHGGERLWKIQKKNKGQ